VEDLQKAGANLEIKDDGWMVVETANANAEDVVERRQRLSLSVHIGSYVYKARFTIYDVKGFVIVRVLGKCWMRDINGRYHLNHYNANPAPPPAPIHHLRRFGCRAYRLIPEEQRLDKKLGEQLRKCMMVGYVHHTRKPEARAQIILLRGLRKPEAQIILLRGLRKPEAQKILLRRAKWSKAQVLQDLVLQRRPKWSKTQVLKHLQWNRWGTSKESTR
jgi:hypothetical protein